MCHLPSDSALSSNSAMQVIINRKIESCHICRLHCFDIFRHKFCYLCVKGIRSSSPHKKCALCRLDFSLDAIEQGLEVTEEKSTAVWFYSGKFRQSSLQSKTTDITTYHSNRYRQGKWLVAIR